MARRMTGGACGRLRTVRGLQRCALFGVVCMLVSASPCLAKRVICIDVKKDNEGEPVEDGFLANHEGWLRSNPQEGDVIQHGGNLTNCLAQVENGDTLIIVAHGLTGDGGDGVGFEWQGQQYTGFGTGVGLMPVPEGFDELMNVTVDFCSCWSANDPDGGKNPDTSLVDKILEAMGGDDSNTGNGFQGAAEMQNCVSYFYPEGVDTPEEKKQYGMIVDRCVQADDAWVDKAPANRSEPAPDPNQESCLQQQLDNCDQFTKAMPAPDITVVYDKAPNDTGAGGDEAGRPGEFFSCGLTGTIIVPRDCPLLPCEADLNGDGRVCQEDLGILLAAYAGERVPSPHGDLDCDNDTDQSDLGILLAQYDGGCGDPCP